MVLITHEHLDRARKAGACSDAMKLLRVGNRVSDVSSELLDWYDRAGLVKEDERVAIVRESAQELGVACEIVGDMPAAVLGGSGSGYGYGYGYG